MSRPYLDGYNEWLKARVKAAKKIGSRAENLPSNERKVTNMSINTNKEVTLKVNYQKTWVVAGRPADQDEVHAMLNQERSRFLAKLQIFGYAVLNDLYRALNLSDTRTGLTYGWERKDLKKVGDLFTWAFCADGTVELIFHNLKDISNLYKTEEELA